MFRLSVDFLQALRRTYILAAAAIMMIFAWAFLRIPSGNLLIIVFAFLAAVRISDYSSAEIRLRILAGMIAGTTVMQFIVSTTQSVHWLNIFLTAAACGVILKNMTSDSAYPVLLTGLLAYPAAAGVFPAAARAIDILIAGGIAWLIGLGAAGKSLPERSAGKPLPSYEAFVKAVTIFCALFLYKILSMPQGIWIVLTIIFIFMVRKPDESNIELVWQRIFSVPLGIFLGGVYSGVAVAFDYRLAYLCPLIGAAGFFMLYYRHDFFMFSLFFMFAFTVCADWLAGTGREFHFVQFLAARSLATIIGAVVLLAVEKLAALGNKEYYHCEKIS